MATRGPEKNVTPDGHRRHPKVGPVCCRWGLRLTPGLALRNSTVLNAGYQFVTIGLGLFTLVTFALVMFYMVQFALDKFGLV